MKFSKLVRLIMQSKTDSIPELARICGRDIKHDYQGADLSEVDLSGEDLSDGEFTYTDFTGANLSNVNFTRANLAGAIFTRAILTGAIFVSANIEGVILDNGVMLDNATTDDADSTSTLAPSSARPPDSDERASVSHNTVSQRQRYRGLAEHAFRNTLDRMVIFRCSGPDDFHLERVIFPFELLNFQCPPGCEVEIWSHGLGGGPELLEAMMAEDLVINEEDLVDFMGALVVNEEPLVIND